MKKILLVKPTYPGSPFGRGGWPVSLGYLAQALQDEGIDYQTADLDWQDKGQLFQKIKSYRPDLLGISLLTCCYKHHYALLSELKDNFTNLRIVAGGPHISILRELVIWGH